MSRKDRFLLSAAPHLVLDGALSAAEALGAGTVYVALPERAEAANRSLAAALAERADAGAVTVVRVPERYLAGEETALVHYIDGGALTPTGTPPLPAERGVGRRPTLVQNVETMAHLGLIARHGGEWFRGVGVPEAPGTALVTLSGAVDRPGIHEIATGTPLAGLLEAAGGPREELRAVLVGGFFGVWVGREDLVGLTLDPAGLRRCGAALGAGVLVALGASSCPAAETSRVLTWLAGESAGQCGPCVHGLAAVAESFERIVAGHADDAERRRLLRWASEINGRGACGLPDGAVRFLRSALHVFAPEIEDHDRYGACEACARPPLLRTPGVIAAPVPA